MNDDSEFDFDNEYYDTDPYEQEYPSNSILTEESEYNPYDF